VANVVFGDAEAAAVAIVRASTDVTAFAPVTVSTDLRGYATGARWIEVHRSGGMPTLWMQIDNPELTFAVRAENKATAHDLADAARSAMFAARSGYVGNGLTVYDVADSAGLTWSPEAAQPGVARYTFTLTLVTRP
jgi:hypothetical protein